MKILVVDDEKDIQTLFEQRFRKEIRDHQIEICLCIFRRRGSLLSNQHVHEAVLILSDINMPGMSGLELLQHIKQKYLHPLLQSS